MAMMERLQDDTVQARPNQVYLAAAVGRRFGIIGDEGLGGDARLHRPGVAGVDRSARRAPAFLAPRLGLPGRRRPNVLVLDTGLRTFDARAEHPALDNCVVHDPWFDLRKVGRWDDEDEPDDDRCGRLDHQAGHGTFISGIIRQLCPDALVHHRGVLTSYGDGDDASVIAAIERGRAAARRGHRHRGDVVRHVRENDRPPPMAEAIRGLLRHSVVVASAGNDATARPYYPAALPGVIGVGGLDQGGRAAFSNFGPWVDACRTGRRCREHVLHRLRRRPAPARCRNAYRGWATWSGTSFSGPKVAAVIAQEMYLQDITAAEAWSAV